MTSVARLLERILSGETLDFEEARGLAEALLKTGTGDVEAAAVLVALRARGESSSEVAGFASFMRDNCVPVKAPAGSIDTAGTGGDGLGTLNASTSAAIVAAAGGAVVAKHGNRSVSSRSGSADFLEALGYRVEHGAQEAGCMLSRAGFAFLYAPKYHPLMARIMPIRRRLGIRTIFNLVGPLSNPAKVGRQVLGVARPSLLSVMAEAGRRLGYERLLVVHGDPGMDEVSVSGPTMVVEVSAGRAERYSVTPEELGLRRHSISELQVGTPRESVERFLRVIGGEGKEADMDFIAANAGAALYVAGLASSLRDGVEEARRLIEEGAVRKKLDEIMEACRECCRG